MFELNRQTGYIEFDGKPVQLHQLKTEPPIVMRLLHNFDYVLFIISILALVGMNIFQIIVGDFSYVLLIVSTITIGIFFFFMYRNHRKLSALFDKQHEGRYKLWLFLNQEIKGEHENSSDDQVYFLKDYLLRPNNSLKISRTDISILSSEELSFKEMPIKGNLFLFPVYVLIWFVKLITSAFKKNKTEKASNDGLDFRQFDLYLFNQ